MKITTENCVDAIIAYLVKTECISTSNTDWKRVSKVGSGDNIIRKFCHKPTNREIYVRANNFEILDVYCNNTTVVNTMVTPKPRTLFCKCKSCGSYDVMLSVAPGNGEDGYDTSPFRLSQKRAKKMIKNSDECMWICLGDCSDECSAVVNIDGKKIQDADDFVEYIAEYGNPKVDKIDVTPLQKKKPDIIKAVRIGDIDTVNEYISSGKNLDTYIGDLPENKNETGMGETNWTLLHYAIDEQQWDVAVALINGGCDVNKPMKHMILTPLMSIFNNKYKSKKMIDVIDALMIHGADLSIKSNGYKGYGVGDDTFHLADIWGKKQHKQYIIDNYPEQYKEYLLKK